MCFKQVPLAGAESKYPSLLFSLLTIYLTNRRSS